MLESGLRRATRAMLAMVLTLSGVAYAQGVLSTSATHPSGLAGSTVFSAFTVDLGSGYNLVTFNLRLDFPASSLSFLEGSSMLQLGDQAPVAMVQALNELATSSAGDFTFDKPAIGVPGQYDLTGMLLLGSMPLSGPVTLHAAFMIDAGAPAGLMPVVQFHVLASQQLPSGHYTDDSFAASSTITVSAIPEPAHWLMLALGLAMVTLVGRTGAGRRSRSSRVRPANPDRPAGCLRMHLGRCAASTLYPPHKEIVDGHRHP